MTYQPNAQAIAQRRQSLRMAGANKYQRAASQKASHRHGMKVPHWFGDVIVIVALGIVVMFTLYL